MASGGEWVAVSGVSAFLADPAHAGWLIGQVDAVQQLVWIASPDYAQPAPDMNKPWPGRPANEVPRAKYRNDGTVELSGYIPSGDYVEVELPFVRVTPGGFDWVKTEEELDALIAPAREQLRANKAAFETAAAKSKKK